METATAPKKAPRATQKAGSTPAKRVNKTDNANQPTQGGAAAALDKSKAHLEGKGTTSETKAKPTENVTPAESPATKVSDSDTTLRGGTKQVKIEMMPVMARGGFNVGKEETYPFSKLAFSEKTADGLVGPSFFVPNTENPAKHIATARKRVRGEEVQFITRRATEIVEGEEDAGPQLGQRIWKCHPKDGLK